MVPVLLESVMDPGVLLLAHLLGLEKCTDRYHMFARDKATSTSVSLPINDDHQTHHHGTTTTKEHSSFPLEQTRSAKAIRPHVQL